MGEEVFIPIPHPGYAIILSTHCMSTPTPIFIARSHKTSFLAPSYVLNASKNDFSVDMKAVLLGGQVDSG